MPVKLVVLYPHPRDAQEFERQYLGKHLPLMRELLGPDVRLPTYLTVGAPDRPFYRVAEIHFGEMERLNEFVRSGKAAIGSKSAHEVSTGGPPVTLVCEEQGPI
jgi:uncharacterized protein (TIGR02118 family)